MWDGKPNANMFDDIYIGIDDEEPAYPFDCKVCGRQGRICLDQYNEFWLCERCYEKYIIKKDINDLRKLQTYVDEGIDLI